MMWIVANEGAFERKVYGGNIEWDATHYCPADKLTPTEAAQFGVFPLTLTERPACNPATEAVDETDPALIDGAWTQQWTVRAATAEEITERTQAHWASIQSIREAKTQQGGFPAAGKWFHSDIFSRTQQLGLTMMGANIPAGLQWKTMDGSFVTMTPTLAGQIFASAAQQDAAIFAHAEALRAQGLGADINAGWPATFGSLG